MLGRPLFISLILVLPLNQLLGNSFHAVIPQLAIGVVPGCLPA
jgi:hypothetical protein